MGSEISRSNKKDNIVKAAVQVFSQKGYHSAKMEEIAVLAGIGKATIYEYFTSKLQLLQEILERSSRRYEQAIMDQLDHARSLTEKIKGLLESHFRFYQDNKTLTRILFWDMEIVDEEIKDFMLKKRKEMDDKIHGLIIEGIESGEFRPVEPRLLAVMVSGVLGAMWVPITIEEWDIDPALAAQQFMDIVMNGIKKV